VGGDEAVSILELANRVARGAGSGGKVTLALAPTPGKSAGRYVPDVSKAEQVLGLKTWIPLDEAIRRTLQWCAPDVAGTEAGGN